jgi:folate-binding protein YgfZ
MSPVYSLLAQRACIEARGADATAFLHGQLSRTIDRIGVGHAPLAAWLDARGRVRALFRVLRLDDRWLLITERDVVQHVVQKLKMFVLRAAVVIAPTDDWAVAAVVAAGDAGLGDRGPPLDAPRDAVLRQGEIRWVRIGPGLWNVVGAPRAIDDLGASVERAPASAAELAEIRLGIPAVTAAVAERHVAQTLNLDKLDAVSFDKGCYPGQEVVARVHNLGAVKRHLRRYESRGGAAPAPGTAVASNDQTAGEIVRAAPTPTGFEALAVIEDSAAGGGLMLGGTPLHELPLP